eukprot:TRINITY_DN29989_c0_g1_i1.p1 TRINITY_DN29989_c0_g1~~TRINITY_DN29989_c0_g1_i1.p1  ORF type:complete len:166 (-),score=37.10 TRINITY_DN29989_c0_g1_i1:270-725(-)
MGRLKNIPDIISPDLLHVLSSMGHGDRIVIADANFPAASTCNKGSAKLVNCQGHPIPKLLEAILQLLPLDTYVDKPVQFMDLTDSDKAIGMKPPGLWQTYQEICSSAEGREVKLDLLERFQFYDEAKDAYAIVASGETAKYANIILRKGVI